MGYGWDRPGRGESFRYSGPNGRTRYACIDCRYVGDQTVCPECGMTTELEGPVARPPKKNAHKSKWDEYAKHLGKGRT